MGVVTVGRSDYGSYLPVLRRIQADPELKLHLIIAGAHLLPEFGSTAGGIEKDGFEIGERVEIPLSSDSPEGIACSMGLATAGFAQSYARSCPDILVVLGDRFEMHAAALAALPFKIPVAHLHGGEITRGTMDDALRHSLTKLSHLHFVSTKKYARRVMQLGEEPWRIMVSGAPGLENLKSVRLLESGQLEAEYGLHVEPQTLLATFHPVTLEYEETETQVDELLAALEACERPVIFTMPNADTNHRVIRRRIKAFVQAHPSAQAAENLGTKGYFSLMSLVAAMVGNSSSGLIEAPSFGLPVVNIGTRQEGRVRAPNVIDAGYRREDIIEAVEKALRPEFRESLRNRTNPYFLEQASDKIVQRLKEVPLDKRLVMKRFNDPV